MSISDIEVVTKRVPGQSWQLDFASGKSERTQKEVGDHHFKFSHVIEHGSAVFNLMGESSRTRNILFLADPVLNMLNKVRVVVVDELDTSLHILLLRELVNVFHRRDINKENAQLVFSTHDTSLSDAHDLFRRDQIRFVEKNRDQASALIS